MKYLLCVTILFTIFSLQSASAGETSQRNATTGEERLSVSALGSASFDGDDNFYGGDGRAAYRFTRLFHLGLRAGCQYVADSEAGDIPLFVPIDIVTEWRIPIRNSRVSIPIAYSIGLGLYIDSGDSADPTIHSELEVGVHVRITNLVSIQGLVHGGYYYDPRYWPLPLVGGKIGPVFSF